MGGGGSGGSYKAPDPSRLQQLVEEARAAETAKLNAQVNDLLREKLQTYNDRDIDEIRARLETIAESVQLNLEDLLFGGSVAKHTYVDGLSDVDALAMLDRETTQGLSAQDVLNQLHQDINERLPRDDIASIERGTLAVTITYQDGSEIQILPAVRVGEEIKIPDSSGQGWNATNPGAFRTQLTQQNQRLDGNLVPAIKLVKSLVSDLPEQQKVTGYHIEALALDAVSGYRNESSPRVLIDKILDHASARVRQPIQDITRQSRTVDEYLGSANSAERRLVSQALGAIRRRLNAATSVSQWEAMFSTEAD